MVVYWAGTEKWHIKMPASEEKNNLGLSGVRVGEKNAWFFF